MPRYCPRFGCVCPRAYHGGSEKENCQVREKGRQGEAVGELGQGNLIVSGKGVRTRGPGYGGSVVAECAAMFQNMGFIYAEMDEEGLTI